jgi:serine/threonine-protein kinase
MTNDSPKDSGVDTNLQRTGEMLTQRGEGPSLPDHSEDLEDRYEILELVKAGAIAGTYRAYDRVLGRVVALRILDSEWAASPAARLRFLAEYRIAARLQHPALPPVYGGRMGARHPFYTTTLFPGKSFGDRLDQRTSPRQNLSELLQQFQLAAQAVAYAHSQGVAHLGLTPDHLLIGPFGEVFVVAWEHARDATDDESVLSSGHPPLQVPAPPDVDWRYTAPELLPPVNSRGDIRSDVFSLGSILCEILTGAPALDLNEDGTGPDMDSLSLAVRRLEECDHELAELCITAISPAPDDRLYDATVLARSIIRTQAHSEERAQVAEAAAAAATKEAAHEQQRRRIAVTLMFTMLTLGLITFASYLIYQTRRIDLREESRRIVDRLLEDALTARDRARMEDGSTEAAWEAALAHLNQAEQEINRREVDTDLVLRVHRTAERIRSESDDGRSRSAVSARNAFVQRRLLEVFSRGIDPMSSLQEEEHLASAFAALDLHPVNLDPKAEAARLRALPYARDLADGLVRWASHRPELPTRAANLLQLADALDTDPWRQSVRHAVRDGDVEQIAMLVKSGPVEALSAGLLVEVCHALMPNSASAVESVLTRVLEVMPSSFWPHLLLAEFAATLPEPDWPRVEQHATAALTIQSRSSSARHLRAKSRIAAGSFDLALADLNDAILETPHRPVLHLDRAHALYGLKRWADARDAYLMSLACRPSFGDAYDGVAKALFALNDTKGAASVLEESVRHLPERAEGWRLLGLHCAATGQTARAFECLEKAWSLAPQDVEVALGLGRIHAGESRRDQALQWFRKAVAFGPESGVANLALGTELLAQRQAQEALPYLQRAVQVLPQHRGAREAHLKALDALGRFDEALEHLALARSALPAGERWDALDSLEMELKDGASREESLRGVLLKGAALPSSEAELLALLQHTIRRGDPSLAATFVRHVLKSKKANDHHGLLLEAARSALRSWVYPKSTQGAPATSPGRDAWCLQALEWLEEEARGGLPKETLQSWRQDPVLAATSRAEILDSFPPDLAKRWARLWSPPSEQKQP